MCFCCRGLTSFQLYCTLLPISSTMYALFLLTFLFSMSCSMFIENMSCSLCSVLSSFTWAWTYTDKLELRWKSYHLSLKKNYPLKNRVTEEKHPVNVKLTLLLNFNPLYPLDCLCVYFCVVSVCVFILFHFFLLLLSSLMIWCLSLLLWDFPGGSDGKAYAYSAEELGSFPGLGRSPGEGHDNPLQYSCLENPHGQRILAGYSPWRCKQSDTTEQLTLTFYRSKMAEDLMFIRAWASFILTVIHQHLNDTPTGTMVVPRVTIKGQKVGSGPIPGKFPSYLK